MPRDDLKIPRHVQAANSFTSKGNHMIDVLRNTGLFSDTLPDSRRNQVAVCPRAERARRGPGS